MKGMGIREVVEKMGLPVVALLLIAGCTRRGTGPTTDGLPPPSDRSDAIAVAHSPGFVEVTIRFHREEAGGVGSDAHKTVKADGTISGSHMSWGAHGASPSGYSEGRLSQDDMTMLRLLVQSFCKQSVRGEKDPAGTDYWSVVVALADGTKYEARATAESDHTFASENARAIWVLIRKYQAGSW